MTRCKHDMLPGMCAFCTDLRMLESRIASAKTDACFDAFVDPPKPGTPGETGIQELTQTPNDSIREVIMGKRKSSNDSKSCRVTGCTNRLVAQGFCLSHYDKWRKGKLEGNWPPFKRVRGIAKNSAVPPAKEKTVKVKLSGKIVRMPEAEWLARKRIPIAPQPVKSELVLDLTDYPDLLEGLGAVARKHIRSVQHEAVYGLLHYLVKEGQIAEAP